jgi:serine/threonine protein kinase
MRLCKGFRETEAVKMADYDGWQTLGEQLGKGGQGTVYLARSPRRAEHIHSVLKELRERFRNLSEDYGSKELARCVVTLGSSDRVEDLGALKTFDIPEGVEEPQQLGFPSRSSAAAEDARKALGRLEQEVLALSALQENPAVLKLLHSNPAKRFIVTEYHPNGTLNKHLFHYKGKALE